MLEALSHSSHSNLTVSQLLSRHTSYCMQVFNQYFGVFELLVQIKVYDCRWFLKITKYTKLEDRSIVRCFFIFLCVPLIMFLLKSDASRSLTDLDRQVCF